MVTLSVNRKWHDYGQRPYKVHEGVSGCDISPVGQIRLLSQVLLASPWPDHSGDADDDDNGNYDHNIHENL